MLGGVNRIRLLSEQVANQIAAGEVVERPASVVKELVENALDAGATRINVEIQAGGRSLIRVTDDGQGMSRDDALMAFERHATSKIRQAEDLNAIATMGFRGEALPSIASVSRLTLTTRERDRDNPEATQVIIHGGKIQDVRAASGPPGTSVEVRQIFYNLPARRKFLRSEETERSHIHHYLTLAALSSPAVGLTFTHNQRAVWQLPPVPGEVSDPTARMNAPRERLRALYGGELRLLPVEFAAPLRLPARFAPPPGEAEDPAPDQSEFRVWGFIGAPGVSRATRQDQHLFVNRRPVENRGLNFALLEGYHTSLMKGRYPVCCLFLEIHPVLVDVNIHPAKREVKFRLEREVRGLVTRAVKRALLGIAPGAASSRTEGPPAKPAATSTPQPTPQAVPPSPAAEPLSLGLDDDPLQRLKSPEARPPTLPGKHAASAPTSGPPPAAAPVDDRPAPAASQLPVPSGPTPEPSPASATARPQAAEPPPAGSATPPTSEPATGQGAPLLNVPLRLVGVIGRLYVVLESDRGLVLLDQHAAHERVLFEQMLRRLEQGPAPCQRLLLPETVEVSARDATFLRAQLPSFARLGLGLSEFGERTFLLDALPPFARGADARTFVLEVIDDLRAAGQGLNRLRLGEEMIAKTVCRHAVKANDPLQAAELEELIRDLRRCAMPYTCPHGRPTLIEFSYHELEKRFGRSQ